MVHTSPRIVDDLDWENSEPEASTLADPRFSLRALSLENTGFSDADNWRGDDRPLPKPSGFSARRRKRERETLGVLERAPSYSYPPRLVEDEFRLCILQPGAGEDPIACSIIKEHWKSPPGDYRCLSYAWGSPDRDEAILVDGHNFPVTTNLLNALQRIRNSKRPVKYWIDQICINQDDIEERQQQVDVMKHIFRSARKIHIWLGESNGGSEMLFRYAKQIRRSEESSQRQLLKLGGHRNIRDAMRELLERPWFQRVWVIPEVVLAQRTTVRAGPSTITWETLVRLIRYVSLPPSSGGFNKEVSLLGNARQRIAIITQMIASTRDGRDHTDITSLIILAKASRATHPHDQVYAFFGLTYLSLYPNYLMRPQDLFVDIIEYYVWNILESDPFAACHQLTPQQKTSQVMSILYSAGALHQDHEKHGLPSWIPDWTFLWHLAPIFCKTIPNFLSSSRDEWSSGIRSDYRASGETGELGEFEVIKESHHLRLSAILIDSIETVTEAPTPESSQTLSASPSEPWELSDASMLRYGRSSFTTAKGYSGVATPGIAAQAQDHVAILLGGDVPVVIRRVPSYDGREEAYQLLCECFVESPIIMFGDFFRANWPRADEIILI